MNLSTNTSGTEQTSASDSATQEAVIQCNHAGAFENVYAIGYIKPFFSTLDLEKQYEAAAKVVGKPTTNYSDIFNYSVTNQNQPTLNYRPFMYLAKQATWVLTVNNVDTFELKPSTPTQLDALIAAAGLPTDLFILVGQTQHHEPGFKPSLPTVRVEHLIDITKLQAAHKTTSSSKQLTFPAIKPNIGRTATARATNYLTTHFGQINLSEANTDIMGAISEIHFEIQANLSDRQIIEFILTSPDANRYACSIDVSDRYPFVASPLAPFAKSN